MHHNTKGSDTIQKLREEPQTGIDLPNGGPARSMIHKFSVKSAGRGGGKGRNGTLHGGTTTVYHLIGDERRAIRKFIKINSEFVEDCMDDVNNNPISTQLDGVLLEIFKEEYKIMKYTDEL